MFYKLTKSLYYLYCWNFSIYAPKLASIKIIFEKTVKMMMKGTLFGESFRAQGYFVLLFFFINYRRDKHLTSGDRAGFMPGMQRSLTLEDQSL